MDKESVPLIAEAAELFLEKAFLESELEDQRKRTSEIEQKVDGLQVTLSESAGYNKFLLRAVDGYRREVADAYDQLGEVPQLLDKARYSGYLARVKEVALARIKARKRERENRVSTRVTSLMTTVGDKLRNII